MRTKQEILKEIDSIQKEIERNNEAMMALCKELDKAPDDFTKMSDGLYFCVNRNPYDKGFGDPRFIIKLGKFATAYSSNAEVMSDNLAFIADRVACNEYDCLQMLMPINVLPDLSDINWEIVENNECKTKPVVNPISRNYVTELRKIAERVRLNYVDWNSTPAGKPLS